jgi:hypothetical protein
VLLIIREGKKDCGTWNIKCDEEKNIIFLQLTPPVKMEQTECSEISAHKSRHL